VKAVAFEVGNAKLEEASTVVVPVILIRPFTSTEIGPCVVFVPVPENVIL
jgi:hypothetical protein